MSLWVAMLSIRENTHGKKSLETEKTPGSPLGVGVWVSIRKGRLVATMDQGVLCEGWV